jgi:hypothetical protein
VPSQNQGMRDEATQPNAERAPWLRWAFAAMLLIVLYALSTGPMTFVVSKLNGGSRTVGWPLRILVLPYWPFYRALDHAPQPIVRAWEAYDGFFYRLATRS